MQWFTDQYTEWNAEFKLFKLKYRAKNIVYGNTMQIECNTGRLCTF